MSTRLKALGLGLLALFATSAFALNASATPSGHFEAEESHIIVEGTESNPGEHHLEFRRTNSSGEAVGDPIECTHVRYHGTVDDADKTTQEVSLTPEYKNCATSSGTWGEVTVHHEKTKTCETNVFKFTSGNPGTVHVECPVTVTHPNCTIRMPKQTVSGMTYHTIMQDNRHALTATVDVDNITGHFEAGICVFLGTTHKFHMKGSVTVWGENTAGEARGITHTAP